MWSHVICSSSTGGKRKILRARSDRCSPRLNGVGDGQHAFALAGTRLSRDQVHDLYDLWRSVVVKCWNGRPVYAGFIQDWDWDPKTKTLDTSTVEFRGILTRRLPYGIGTYADGTLVAENQTYRGIIYQLVAEGTRGNRSPVWDLPVVIPATGESGGQSRTYENYKYVDIEQAISELQKVGGDIDFEPRWSGSGSLEWLLRVAPDSAPRLGGNAVQVTQGAAATSIRYSKNGSKMVTGVFTTGEGQEAKRPHGEWATVAVAGGVPSLDVVRSQNNISDVGALNSHSQAQVEAYYAPTISYRVEALASKVMDRIQMGSPVRANTRADEVMPGGFVNLRCIGLQHNLTQKVTIETQAAA